jgi:hypothetical protein
MASVTTVRFLTETAEGRPCDPNEILRQIGSMRVLAISGGRAYTIRNEAGEAVGVRLPCATNRCVDVVLDWDDTYTVRQRRVIAKGINKGRSVTEWALSGVYCDEVGERAYYASVIRYG